MTHRPQLLGLRALGALITVALALPALAEQDGVPADDPPPPAAAPADPAPAAAPADPAPPAAAPPAAGKRVELSGQARWISDAPLERIVGTAEGKGNITLDPANPAGVRGTLSMSASTMKTGNTTRDEHLRGSDWLNAAKCPDVTFEITGATLKSQETKGDITEVSLEVTGPFSVNCQSAQLTAPVTLKWKGDKFKADTKFQIKLDDYAIKGRDDVVGSKVGKTIDVEVGLKGLLK